MLKQNKIFYNAVIDGDLFYTIYDYLRFNREACLDYKIFSTNDFDKLTYEDWIYLAHDAIKWLEKEQLPKVTILDFEDNSPSSDTWGTLYYQTLNFMAIKNIRKSIRQSKLNEVIDNCKKCIEYLKEMTDKIREPNEYDLENI